MKNRGFALPLVVTVSAVLLSIFIYYIKETNVKNELKKISENNEILQKSIEEATGVGIYEVYLADQMIAANNLDIIQNGYIPQSSPPTLGGKQLNNPLIGKAMGIQNILGYFIVKDTKENTNINNQSATVKIWENDFSSPEGEWYYGKWEGDSPNYNFVTYKIKNDSYPTSSIPITKGGYIITSIVDKTPNTKKYPSFTTSFDNFKIPILDTSYNMVRYPEGKTVQGVAKYHQKSPNTVYEIKLFKNITLFKKDIVNKKRIKSNTTYDFSEIVGSYNIYVTLEIYWSDDENVKLNDLKMRNNCSSETDYENNISVGMDCNDKSTRRNLNSNDKVFSKVTSFIVEDIMPIIK